MNLSVRRQRSSLHRGYIVSELVREGRSGRWLRARVSPKMSGVESRPCAGSVGVRETSLVRGVDGRATGRAGRLVQRMVTGGSREASALVAVAGAKERRRAGKGNFGEGGRD